MDATIIISSFGVDFFGLILGLAVDFTTFLLLTITKREMGKVIDREEICYVESLVW